MDWRYLFPDLHYVDNNKVGAHTSTPKGLNKTKTQWKKGRETGEVVVR